MADPIIELDVTDFADEVEQVEPTTAEESSPEETKVDAPAEDTTAEPEADKETEDDDADADDTAEVEETKEPEFQGAEARKAELQNEIRTLVSQRNTLRTEVASQNATAYPVQSAQELIDQGVDPAIARVEALEQRAQLTEYTNYVADLNATVNTEALQVMADYPEFDPKSPTYNEALATRASAMYQQVAQIQRDPQTGYISQAAVTPYNIFKAFAETAAAGAQSGVVRGQKSAEKMLAAAETTSSSAPKQPKEDNFLAGLTKGLPQT